MSEESFGMNIREGEPVLPLHVFAGQYEHMRYWCKKHGLNPRLCVYVRDFEQVSGRVEQRLFVYETAFDTQFQSARDRQNKLDAYTMMRLRTYYELREEQAVEYAKFYERWKRDVDAKARKSL